MFVCFFQPQLFSDSTRLLAKPNWNLTLRCQVYFKTFVYLIFYRFDSPFTEFFFVFLDTIVKKSFFLSKFNSVPGAALPNLFFNRVSPSVDGFSRSWIFFFFHSFWNWLASSFLLQRRLGFIVFDNVGESRRLSPVSHWIFAAKSTWIVAEKSTRTDGIVLFCLPIKKSVIYILISDPSRRCPFFSSATEFLRVPRFTEILFDIKKTKKKKRRFFFCEQSTTPFWSWTPLTVGECVAWQRRIIVGSSWSFFLLLFSSKIHPAAPESETRSSSSRLIWLIR